MMWTVIFDWFSGRNKSDAFYNLKFQCKIRQEVYGSSSMWNYRFLWKHPACLVVLEKRSTTVKSNKVMFSNKNLPRQDFGTFFLDLLCEPVVLSGVHCEDVSSVHNKFKKKLKFSNDILKKYAWWWEYMQVMQVYFSCQIIVRIIFPFI